MEKKKQNKYTDKQKKDAKEAIKNGMSIGEAAAYAGVPYYSVYDWKKSGKFEDNVAPFSRKCPDCDEPPFTSPILYAQHRSAKHPHGGKRVMKSSQRKPQITNAFVDKQGGSHTVNEHPPLREPSFNWQVAEDNIVARVIKQLEDKPAPVITVKPAIEEVLAKMVSAYMAAHPAKVTMDEFMGMLKTLFSENTQRGEELARLRKSLGDWQQRAGRIMEQAQELATKK